MTQAHQHARLGRLGRLDRRRLLQIGGLGSLGLHLSDVLHAHNARPSASRRPRTIDSCIVLFYYGGPSHLDTWDLKPHAPAEIRGEFRSIATRVPGLAISGHLPSGARVT